MKKIEQRIPVCNFSIWKLIRKKKKNALGLRGIGKHEVGKISFIRFLLFTMKK